MLHLIFESSLEKSNFNLPILHDFAQRTQSSEQNARNLQPLNLHDVFELMEQAEYFTRAFEVAILMMRVGQVL